MLYGVEGKRDLEEEDERSNKEEDLEKGLGGDWRKTAVGMAEVREIEEKLYGRDCP